MKIDIGKKNKDFENELKIAKEMNQIRRYGIPDDFIEKAIKNRIDYLYNPNIASNANIIKMIKFQKPKPANSDKIKNEVIDSYLKRYPNVVYGNKSLIVGGLQGAGKSYHMKKIDIDLDSYIEIGVDEIIDILVEKNLMNYFDSFSYIGFVREIYFQLQKTIFSDMKDGKHKNVVFEEVLYKKGYVSSTIKHLKKNGYDKPNLYVVLTSRDDSYKNEIGRYISKSWEFENKLNREVFYRVIPWDNIPLNVLDIIKKNVEKIRSKCNKVIFLNQ
jgi:hypothetical protein